MEQRNVELLAPAGSYAGLEAALGAGADAVYAGGPAFGARAYAENFSREDLIRAIDTVHIHGKKLYLTVNTLLKNRELEEQLYDYLFPFYEAGLDAVLVQDMGALRFIRRNFPDLDLHASTQMAVTGPKSMEFLKGCGVSRAVAARELSLEELETMHRESSVELETFVHGALCYSYSGMCLMSSMFGGRSGNRGRCAQPCRLEYRPAGSRDSGRKICPLSMKDLNTLDILPKIVSCGISSLKIEGRMKQPEYAAGVVSVYRKYLDRLEAYGPQDWQIEREDRDILRRLFSRGGSCTGYYEQHNGPSMIAFANEKKTENISWQITRAKRKISGELLLTAGKPAQLTVSCGGNEIRICGGEVQKAMTQTLDRERVLRQMSKLGDTEFAWETLAINMDKDVFVPMGALNELRREAAGKLTEALLAPERRQGEYRPLTKPKKTVRAGNAAGRPEIFVSCETSGQAREAETFEWVSGMYLPFDVMGPCMASGLGSRKKLYLSLPHIVRGTPPGEYIRKAETWLAQGMQGFLVRSLEGYAVLRELGWGGRCVLDASLYTWNDEAAAFWKEEGAERNTVPLELNGREILHRDNADSELLVYGYLPLMLSAQCLRKNIYGCDRRQGTARFRDRYGKEFPSVCVCRPWKTENTGDREFCYNIIYNSIPYGLFQEMDQVKALGVKALRLGFTTESPSEVRAVLTEFFSAYQGEGTAPEREFTKGHFKRGAE